MKFYYPFFFFFLFGDWFLGCFMANDPVIEVVTEIYEILTGKGKSMRCTTGFVQFAYRCVKLSYPRHWEFILHWKIFWMHFDQTLIYPLGINFTYHALLSLFCDETPCKLGFIERKLGSGSAKEVYSATWKEIDNSDTCNYVNVIKYQGFLCYSMHGLL